ncbi:hypothetical protein KW464_18575, partial [Vibrio fluvialis]|nr:hypothetical protein [Vibrio fluvialis]
ALNSGVCLILVFLVVIVHLVSDCTHLTRCPKLLVRIKGYWQGMGQKWITVIKWEMFFLILFN